ncbi:MULTISPECIES: Na(+)/H(+) antiporter subunit B [Spongiibacter]|uniref:Na(+)/H(+) antiporter subunit B n=1 Tax=Spongiibacter TaxID=630749 RepID=UPI00257B1124|nr:MULTISPECIES: Na(+)/H(+) antiporter subunit B [unclassified Spongiibacter]MEE2653310.1 Na(+)/H(+) antiporter subunit B [Pseudomonadota bacterium]
MSLLSMLIATAIGIAVNRDLLSVVMLSSIYGLLSANFFVTMDAVDVAFTEAAVGAGISPLLMFTTMAIVGRYEKLPHRWSLSALVLVSITGALLLVATMDMPAFGAPDAPAQQHVAPRYIEQSGQEVGIPNIVTSVLATYRGFDTFGEVTVIFTAGVGVLSLLMVGDRATKPLSSHLLKASQHKILRIVSKVLIAPILLFALYVQFHGDYGPGGGFQAGVIFAAAIIVYTMLFGLDSARQVIDQAWVRVMAAVGVLLYGAVGVVSMVNGGNFLDYDVLAKDPLHGQHYGIIVIELGVGITVAAVMVLIYFSFAGRLVDRGHQDD